MLSVATRHIEQLQILRIQGSARDRARGMGQQVLQGMLPRDVQDYFAGILDQYHATYSAPMRLPAKLLYWIWRKSRFQLQGELFEEMLIFAREAGIPREQLLKALVLPDILASTFGGLKILESPLLQFGCTFVSKKNADGSFVTGRNLDFSGVGLWDRVPILLAIHPEAGSQELSHIVVSSSPLFFGSITGVNEAGLQLAIHQIYTKDIWGRGIPVYLIGEHVLRNARSIEDALKILKSNRTGPLWACVITDLIAGRSVSVEFSRRRFHVYEGREETGTREFAQTNHLQGVPKSERDRIEALPHTVAFNSRYRLQKIHEMLGNCGPSATIGDIASILSYRSDGNSRVPSPFDIQKPVTIQSCMIRSHRGALQDLYVSVDPAPTPGGRFARFSLQDLLDPAKDLKSIDFTIEHLTNPEPRARQAQLQMVELFHLWEKGLFQEALDLLDTRANPAGISGPELILRNLALYKLKQPIPAIATPSQVTQGTLISLRALELLSAIQLGSPRARCLVLAQETEKLNPQDPAIRQILKRIRRKSRLGTFLSNPTYDWFGGALCWRLGW